MNQFHNDTDSSGEIDDHVPQNEEKSLHLVLTNKKMAAKNRIVDLHMNVESFMTEKHNSKKRLAENNSSLLDVNQALDSNRSRVSKDGSFSQDPITEMQNLMDSVDNI